MFLNIFRIIACGFANLIPREELRVGAACRGWETGPLCLGAQCDIELGNY